MAWHLLSASYFVSLVDFQRNTVLQAEIDANFLVLLYFQPVLFFLFLSTLNMNIVKRI